MNIPVKRWEDTIETTEKLEDVAEYESEVEYAVGSTGFCTNGEMIVAVTESLLEPHLLEPSVMWQSCCRVWELLGEKEKFQVLG